MVCVLTGFPRGTCALLLMTTALGCAQGNDTQPVDNSITGIGDPTGVDTDDADEDEDEDDDDDGEKLDLPNPVGLAADRLPGQRVAAGQPGRPRPDHDPVEVPEVLPSAGINRWSVLV